MSRELVTLTDEAVKHLAERGDFGAMQAAVYVMAGGGLVGRSAAEQPADFYIDDRVSRRPYPIKVIHNAVKTLERIAVAKGLDPRRLPEMPNFGNLGYF